MGRGLVSVRDATVDDVDFLTRVWADAMPRSDAGERCAVVERVLREVEASDDCRVVLAEHDGSAAGAALLAVGRLTPLDPEAVLQVVSPHVLPEFRRHGVGNALMAAAATFAEEHQVASVLTAVAQGARGPNRFMARLGLGPLATVRMAPTPALRSRLAGHRAPGTSQRSRVLAARRSMRRASDVAPG